MKGFAQIHIPSWIIMSFLTRWDELDFSSLLIRTEGGNLGPLGKHIINPSSHHKIWWGWFPEVVSLHHLTHCSFLENHQRFRSKVGFTKAIGGDSQNIFFAFSTPGKLGKSFENIFICYYFLLVVLNAQLNLSFGFLPFNLFSSANQVLPPRLDQQTSTKRFKVKLDFFFFRKKMGMGSPKIPQFCFLGGGILLAKSDLMFFFGDTSTLD